MTKNGIWVESLSGCVTKILGFHWMSKIDLPPDFWIPLMHSFPIIYATMGPKVDGLAVRDQNDFKIPFWLTWFRKGWLQSRLGSILLKHRPTLKWSLRRRWVQNKKIKPSGLWGTVTHIVSNLIYHTYLESSGQWVCPFIFCHPGLFRVLKKVEKYFYQRDPGVPM